MRVLISLEPSPQLWCARAVVASDRAKLRAAHLSRALLVSSQGIIGQIKSLQIGVAPSQLRAAGRARAAAATGGDAAGNPR